MPQSESVDALDEDPAPLTYAQWKFVQYAATFYHEAKKEGGLDAYFALVDWLYHDRWPEECYQEARVKVSPHILCQRFVPEGLTNDLLPHSAPRTHHHRRAQHFQHCPF